MPDPYWFKAGSSVARSVGYTASAPLVLTVQPAGHTPGFYLLSLVLVVRVAALTGNLTRSYQYSAPTFGNTSIVGFGSGNITTTGHLPSSFTTVSAFSDGVSAITITLTPAAITGSPVVDVSGNAFLAGA